MTAVSASGLFELSDEQQEIVAAVREFVEREVIPVADELEHRDEFPEKIVERMKELGLFGLTVPEEFGGAGLAPLHTGPPARNAGAPAYRGGIGAETRTSSNLGPGTAALLGDPLRPWRPHRGAIHRST